MPALTQADPTAVHDSASEHSIAFIMWGQQAIYDYEDPSIALRFLTQYQRPGELINASPQISVSAHLWTAIPLELSVNTLLSAGAAAACRATGACHGWRTCLAAQKLFERIHEVATGSSCHGCSASHLGKNLIASQLITTVAQAELNTDWPPKDSALRKNTRKSPPIHLPCVCVATLLDADMTFAVLQNGELRCHHVGNGKLLGTARVKKLSKGTSVTCAALIKDYAFLVGDSGGGLNMTLRDDLCEVVQLRSFAPSAVTALSDMGVKAHELCAIHANGCFEVLRITPGNTLEAILSISIKPHPSSALLAPTLAVCSVAEEPLAIIAIAADCLRLWPLGRTSSEVSVARNEDVVLRSSDDMSGKTFQRGRCSLALLGVRPTRETTAITIVTACSLDASMYWWSLDEKDAEACACLEGAVDGLVNAGGVLALASNADLLVALHSNSFAALWHGASRSIVLQIPTHGTIGSAVALDESSMSLSWHQWCGRVETPSKLCLQCVGFSHKLPEEVQDEKAVKEKKTKAPRQSKPSDKEAKVLAKLRGNTKYGKGYSV